MRFKRILFINIIYSLTILSQNALAGVDDYYREAKKIKNTRGSEAATLQDKHIYSEQIKKMNAMSASNQRKKEESDRKAAKFKAEPDSAAPAVAEKTASKSTKKSPTPKSSIRTESSSGPIKVDHETPDELEFPGDETEKKKQQK